MRQFRLPDCRTLRIIGDERCQTEMPEKMIRIGNQTYCHEAARVPFEFAVKNGFDAFEWFSDIGRSGWCEDMMPASERAVLRRRGIEANILFSVHAPWRADPTTPDGAELILRSIRFGSDIGAGVVNFHQFAGYSPQKFADSMLPLLIKARDAGIRLTIENTADSSPDSFNRLFALLNQMPEASGLVGMCLDIGHANLFAETGNDFLRYVECLDRQVAIFHLHAHENFGDRDSHLPLFSGPSAQDDSKIRALAGWLKDRHFSGSVVMEQWPQPPEILIKTRQKFLQIWNGNDCLKPARR